MSSVLTDGIKEQLDEIDKRVNPSPEKSDHTLKIKMNESGVSLIRAGNELYMTHDEAQSMAQKILRQAPVRAKAVVIADLATHLTKAIG